MAVGDAQAVGVVAPAAAAQVVAGRGGVLVRGPLPDVAGHVEQTEGQGAGRHGDRLRKRHRAGPDVRAWGQEDHRGKAEPHGPQSSARRALIQVNSPAKVRG